MRSPCWGQVPAWPADSCGHWHASWPELSDYWCSLFHIRPPWFGAALTRGRVAGRHREIHLLQRTNTEREGGWSLITIIINDALWGFYCKQQVIFTFSVPHQNTPCICLRPKSRVHFPPHKTSAEQHCICFLLLYCCCVTPDNHHRRTCVKLKDII